MNKKYPKGKIQLVRNDDCVVVVEINNTEHSKFLFQNYQKLGFVSIEHRKGKTFEEMLK